MRSRPTKDHGSLLYRCLNMRLQASDRQVIRAVRSTMSFHTLASRYQRKKRRRVYYLVLREHYARRHWAYVTEHAYNATFMDDIGVLRSRMDEMHRIACELHDKGDLSDYGLTRFTTLYLK